MFTLRLRFVVFSRHQKKHSLWLKGEYLVTICLALDRVRKPGKISHFSMV